MQEIFRYTIK